MNMKNCFSYFKNEECAFFPCHKSDGEFFNCMFCFCPLYALGDKCGGNFVYIEDGIKDCSNCMLPHSEAGHAYICSKFAELAQLAKKSEEKE